MAAVAAHTVVAVAAAVAVADRDPRRAHRDAGRRAAGRAENDGPRTADDGSAIWIADIALAASISGRGAENAEMEIEFGEIPKWTRNRAKRPLIAAMSALRRRRMAPKRPLTGPRDDRRISMPGAPPLGGADCCPLDVERRETRQKYMRETTRGGMCAGVRMFEARANSGKKF